MGVKLPEEKEFKFRKQDRRPQYVPTGISKVLQGFEFIVGCW